MRTFSFLILACLVVSTAACGSSVDTAAGTGDGNAAVHTADPNKQDSVVPTPKPVANSNNTHVPFSPTASEPIEPGLYNIHLRLDTAYTTCPLSMCGDDFNSSYDLEYKGNAIYQVSTPTTTADEQVKADADHNNAPEFFWQSPMQNGVSNAGCATASQGTTAVYLHPNSLSGAYVWGWSARACNGYAAANCHCAFEISTTSFVPNE